MRKNAPLAFCIITLLLSSVTSYSQTNGGWGICEFTTVAAMNAFNPSGSNFTCKKVFVQATNEHYRWDGTAWVLESSSASAENIYTVSDTLTEDRTVTLDGNDLTFAGSANDVVIESTGEVGIGTNTPDYELDVRGIADVRDHLYVGVNAGASTTASMRLANNFTENAATYQLFSTATITSPTLTGDRHSYGAYFNLVNNKTEDVSNGRDSDATAGFFQGRNSNTFTFRNIYGVQGLAETTSTASSNLGNLIGGRFRAFSNTTSGDVQDLYGGDFEARGRAGSTGSADDVFGIRSQINAYGMDIDDAFGLFSYVRTTNGQDGDIADAYGVYGRIRVDSDDGGDINFARAGYFRIDRRGGANLIPTAIGTDVLVNGATTAYGLRVLVDDSNATTNYGLYLDSRNASGNNYGIWGEEGDWVLDEDGDGTIGGTGAGGDLSLGASQDMILYHDGTDSHIFNNMGDLIITDVGNDDIILQVNGGEVGIGTTTPDAKLDVEGGNVRFSDYGGGTYDTGNEAYLLGVEADGDVVEIDANSIGENIYTTDGTISEQRTVTIQNQDLRFDLTGTGEFEVRENGAPAFVVDNPGVGIGVEIPEGTLHIVEATGTAASANAGTVILEHEDNGGSSSVIFKSAVNSGSDYGYIEYSDDGSGNGSTSENALLEIGTENDVPGAFQDDIALMPSGNLGIGTRAPAARLDVDGGSVRFSDYGGGTYLDAATETVPASATYMLGVEADGDVVSMNTAKSAKIFYPPALVIDASTTGTGFTIDLHDEYLTRFGMPAVSSTGAPTAIPTYAEDELFYYVTDFDSNVFSGVQIDANGMMTFNVDTVPTDNCSVMNVVFVVK